MATTITEEITPIYITVDGSGTTIEGSDVTTLIDVEGVGPQGPAGGADQNNTTGYLYLWGDVDTEGSIRFHRLDEVAHIEKLVSGVWEHASLMTGSASVWIGEEVAIAAVGHHLASEDSHEGFGIMPHSHFDNDTMLTDEDTHVAFSYAADPALVFQGDDSGEWTGKTHAFTMESPDNILVKSLTYKTGALAATSNIMIRYYEGTDATGPKIFEQEYGPSLFPANSNVTCIYNGILEFDKGSQYYVTYSSANNFSLKMEPTLTFPWMTGNAGYVRADSLYQTREYVSDYEWTKDTDWLIQGRKIYVCNTTGIQTGTFAENASKWDLLTTVKHVSDTYIPLAQRGAANGVATLDGTSKIPMAQMPVGAMEWKGMWNAATNTPTLTNGNGDITGDVYECNVAGTTDFGAGGITFEVGDWVVYNGTIWEKSVNSESYWYIDGTELKPRDISKNVDVAADFYLGGLAHINTVRSTDFKVNDGTRDRITASMTDTGLVSPSGNKSISVGNTEISVTADGQAIFGLTKNQSFWWAGNSNNYLALASNLLTWKDGTRTRLTIDSDEVKFFSDDGTKSINLKNTGTVVTGDLTGSADLYLTAASSVIHTGANFAINDGTSDRFKVEAAGTLFYSPDGNSNLSVSDESFGFNDSVRPRLGISPASTYMYSPDGANAFELSNSYTKITGQLDLTGDVHFTANDKKIYSSDSKGYLTFGNDGDFSWYDVDNTRTRINITGLGSFLTSPQGAYSFTIAETGLRLYRTGFNEQLEVSTTASILRSPDEAKTITLNNTGTSIAGGTFVLAATLTQITTPTFTLLDAARTRITINNSLCQLVAPAGGYKLGVADTTINFNDGARARVDMNATDSRLVSPDGTVHLDVADDQVSVTGDFANSGDVNLGGNVTVCSADNSKKFTVAPYDSANHAGGVIQLEGGQYHDDWHIDNFWGINRHYMSSSDAAVMQIQNVGTGTCQLQLDGNMVVMGNDSFDTIGDTAALWFGATAGVSITAAFEDMLDIKGHAGIRFSDVGTANYFMLDNGKVYMNNLPTVDPVSAGQLWKSGTAVHVSAG